MSRNSWHRKAGAGDAIGKGRRSGSSPFEKSAHLLVESPVRKAFPAFAGTSFEHNSGRPLLRAVASTVDLPVLHKDFIITERQSGESAAAGAAAILLIAAMFELELMVRLIEEARHHGLETLVEAHSLAEVKKVAHLPFANDFAKITPDRHRAYGVAGVIGEKIDDLGRLLTIFLENSSIVSTNISFLLT